VATGAVATGGGGFSCLTNVGNLPFFKKNSFTAPAPKPIIANTKGTMGFPSATKEESKTFPPRCLYLRIFRLRVLLPEPILNKD